MALPLKEDLSALIEKTAVDLGYFIYESSLLLRGENSQIKVSIDKEGVVSHSDCEQYSKELSARLDDSELLPLYTLEVSSPGVKRKLRDIEEFVRFIKSPVKITYRIADESEEKTETLKGELVSVSEKEISIVVNGNEKHILLSSIKNANLDY